ncbi:MAG: ankyrin repeat domain-containing protein, partial [Aeoliella sp.]
TQTALTHLLQTVGRGDVSGTKRLLDEGASVNDKDPNGKTVLMEAAANGHASLAATLVLLGANVNEQDANGRTPLMYAAENGHASVLQVFRDVEYAVRAMPRDDRKERIRQLAGIERMLLADFEPDMGSFRIDYHVQDKVGETAQMKAASQGNTDWFKALWPSSDLVNDDQRQDAQGRTMLMHAVANNQLGLLRYLANEHTHPNSNIFVNEAASLTNSGGHTALELADELGHKEIADLMRSQINEIIEKITNSIDGSSQPKNDKLWYGIRGRAWKILGDTEQAAVDLERAK